MHFIYLDESGDPGLINSPTQFYILAGLSVHHADWKAVADRLASFRNEIEREYGFSANKELHASEFLGSGFNFGGVSRPCRRTIASKLVALLAESQEIRVFAWAIRKTTFHPLATISTQAMIDLHSWISDKSISSAGSCNHQSFCIIHDDTSNPPFHSTARPPTLIGRPTCQPSSDENFIQTADLIAYLVKQRLSPSSHSQDMRLHELWARLSPVSLGCHVIT